MLLLDGRSLDDASLEARAETLKLDVSRFRSTMHADSTEARLNADIDEAKRIGAKGTPATYINGREVIGARPLDAYREIVEEELAGPK